MNLHIQLGFLDKVAPLSYSNPANILLDNNPDNIIGTCEIITDSKMNHFGNCIFFEMIDDNLYLYYHDKLVNDGVYNLSHLSLHIEPRKQSFTKQLKEMVVK